MSGSNWLKFAATIGLTICLLGEASAQPESQNGGVQRSTEDTAGNQAPSVEPDQFLALRDALERIAGALETQTNSQQPAAQTEQAVRDLAAQEKMALWALWMFVAAAAGTFFTAVGLFLIWRTVIYTRAAAGSAKEAVEEARNATAAARAAVDETRRIGEAQVRAYLSCSGGEVQIVRNYLHCDIFIKNHGQSPAPRCEVDCVLMMRDTATGYHRTTPHSGVTASIPAGGSGTAMVVWLHEDIGTERYDAMRRSGAFFDVQAKVRWNDVFGEVQTLYVVLSIETESESGPAENRVRHVTLKSQPMPAMTPHL